MNNEKPGLAHNHHTCTIPRPWFLRRFLDRVKGSWKFTRQRPITDEQCYELTGWDIAHIKPLTLRALATKHWQPYTGYETAKLNLTTAVYSPETC
jgi:hypothetical protein